MDFRSIVEFIKDTSKYIIVIIVVLFIFAFVLGLQQVVGPSMQPNLKEGDILLVNKVVYRFKEPKRFDVVVLSQNDKYMIKRIIGIPGDHIEYKNNTLYINGKVYEEKFIDKNNIKTEDFVLEYKTIPNDMYFMLGDNREDSQDSRNFGLVSKDDIIGKSWIQIWPINEFGLVK